MALAKGGRASGARTLSVKPPCQCLHETGVALNLVVGTHADESARVFL